MASSSLSDRFEDVFQEKIIYAFFNMTEFKKFARSRHRLCLKESDIQDALENNINTTDQKMEMLNKWLLKKGKAVTTQNILDLVERYRKREENTAKIQPNVQSLEKLNVPGASRADEQSGAVQLAYQSRTFGTIGTRHHLISKDSPPEQSKAVQLSDESKTVGTIGTGPHPTIEDVQLSFLEIQDNLQSIRDIVAKNVSLTKELQLQKTALEASISDERG